MSALLSSYSCGFARVCFSSSPAVRCFSTSPAWEEDPNNALSKIITSNYRKANLVTQGVSSRRILSRAWIRSPDLSTGDRDLASHRDTEIASIEAMAHRETAGRKVIIKIRYQREKSPQNSLQMAMNRSSVSSTSGGSEKRRTEQRAGDWGIGEFCNGGE
ncbi:hypothetical protein KFK09_016505 [Dendrobium nobile]|uniref:Uncharacterized protein n=1 Tax=Dendrobium nobile TaxID=94219 RepID=A0A8T3AZN3_DENNO|nr:hypothetical protein KFK09_016505 [Dendrobium nobile]